MGFFPSTPATPETPPSLSPLGCCLSTSTLPLQLDWPLLASRLPSMLELSSRMELPTTTEVLSVATV